MNELIDMQLVWVETEMCWLLKMQYKTKSGQRRYLAHPFPKGSDIVSEGVDKYTGEPTESVSQMFRRIGGLLENEK